VTFVLGIDGGGTRARAVAVDDAGNEVGRGEVAGAVVTVDHPSRAADAVRSAVRNAVEQAGLELPARVMWAGLAGAGSEAANRAVMDLLDDGSLAKRVHVGTDVEAAFHDAFGEGAGVLLIAGTGSVAWARGQSGVSQRAGGWGRFLGDEGSGYSIGLEALRGLARAEDGRIGPTAMRAGLLEACGVASVDALIAWIDTASKAQVAALAPLVLHAAAEGDGLASAIASEAARALVDHIRAAVVSAGPWVGAAPLVLWGGLLVQGQPLRRMVEEALEGLDVRLEMPAVDPAMGAAKLASAV